MKSVLISIQPKWCELIASGKKTIEVRKTKPNLELPFKCYIYCTHSKNGIAYCKGNDILNGKVIGEFVCDKVSVFRPKSITCESAIKKASCLTVQGLIDYAGNKEHIFGWHISDLVIYDKPRDLCEFEKPWCDSNGKWQDIRPCECGKGCKYEYFDYSENTVACGIDYDGDNCPYTKITRPPQSWCYTEV